MGTAVNYEEELINLTKELPSSKVRELWDFAQFLKAKTSGFSYKDVADSGEYVRKIRTAEGKRMKSSKNFVAELLEWQKSDS